MNVYYDKDCNLEVLKHKNISILGFGSQGHAHALNLKDSGYQVCVGLRSESASVKKAEEAGLKIRSIADACEWADLVMLLLPDEVQSTVYSKEIAPNLKPGKSLLFAHGFNIHFNKIEPPADTTVFMVAPKGPGHLVRSTFVEGSGVPCLIAIHQDPNNHARDEALAYAYGLGGGRVGILETTFREETETDLFGEQVVLCGGLTALIKAGFETLTQAGYAPEMAYFECLHEVKLIVDLLYQGGISDMRYSISNTAKYGDITRGPRIITDETRKEMKKILSEIQSGAFAKEWLAEYHSGCKNFNQLTKADEDHPIEKVGQKLRKMFSNLTKKKLVNR